MPDSPAPGSVPTRTTVTAPTVDGTSARTSQNISAAADGVVELSPFVVDTSKNSGYDSANTLSGSRLSTPSKYVGAAVAEITGALMQDLALTNVLDLIDFAPNSSAYNGGGINADTSGNQALFGPKRQSGRPAAPI